MATQITSEIKLVENGRVTVRAIGAGAVNQALKGVIAARQRLAGQAEELIVRPGFITVKGYDGGEVSAIVLNCSLI